MTVPGWDEAYAASAPGHRADQSGLTAVAFSGGRNKMASTMPAAQAPTIRIAIR